jgi:hypothetical protein
VGLNWRAEGQEMQIGEGRYLTRAFLVLLPRVRLWRPGSGWGPVVAVEWKEVRWSRGRWHRVKRTLMPCPEAEGVEAAPAPSSLPLPSVD